MDSSGNLYGTTRAWRRLGDGTVFELAQGSGTITTLASFNGTDGANPVAGLIMDSSGNLYGTTSDGRRLDGDGTVFELAKGSGTITTLASFNGTDGAIPLAGLIMDSSGNLYGTTSSGRRLRRRHGIRAGPGQRHDHHAGFVQRHQRGRSRMPALIMDSSGNCTAQRGMEALRGDGTVFELAQGSGTITTLASFNGTNGAEPDAALIMDSSGNLYGTTSSGGARRKRRHGFRAGPGQRHDHHAGFVQRHRRCILREAGLIMDSSGNCTAQR